MADDRSQAWKAHADGQAEAWARLSHLERLRWLQSAKQFAKLATDAAARRLEPSEASLDQQEAALLVAGTVERVDR